MARLQLAEMSRAIATRGDECVLLTDCTATQSPQYCWDATLFVMTSADIVDIATL